MHRLTICRLLRLKPLDVVADQVPGERANSNKQLRRNASALSGLINIQTGVNGDGCRLQLARGSGIRKSEPQVGGSVPALREGELM